jgi:hypothetical protein
MTMNNAVSCDGTQCGSSKKRRFGGTYRLHHPGDKSRLARNVKWSASRFGRFTRITHWIGGMVGPTDRPDNAEKILEPLGPRIPPHQSSGPDPAATPSALSCLKFMLIGFLSSTSSTPVDEHVLGRIRRSSCKVGPTSWFQQPDKSPYKLRGI